MDTIASPIGEGAISPNPVRITMRTHTTPSTAQQRLLLALVLAENAADAVADELRGGPVTVIDAEYDLSWLRAMLPKLVSIAAQHVPEPGKVEALAPEAERLPAPPPARRPRARERCATR